MFLRQFNKEILRKFGYALLVGTHTIIRILPEPVFKVLKSMLILTGKPFVAKKKHIVLDNLNVAFKGKKSQKEIDQIAQDVFDYTASEMIDLIYYIDRPDKIIGHVSIEGQEHLDEALEAGKGAIMLSAHFGNFILMFCRMVLEGYEMSCMTRQTRDVQFEWYITELRKLRRLKTIYAMPRKRCIMQSIKTLRRNELLYILFDQNYGDDGQVFVNFFNQKAATATGPIILSQRTGAPVLPVFILRKGRQNYCIQIQKPVTFQFNGGGHMELVNNVAKLTKIIEDFIERYPNQWGGWLHNRWKTKPNPLCVYEELEKGQSDNKICV